MNENPQHTFQVLTKKADRLKDVSKHLKWTYNIWMGVSVENEKVVSGIDHLRETRARTKFLSCEPLIGPLENLDLRFSSNTPIIDSFSAIMRSYSCCISEITSSQCSA